MTGNSDSETAIEMLFARKEDLDIDDPTVIAQNTSGRGRGPEPGPTQVGTFGGVAVWVHA